MKAIEQIFLYLMLLASTAYSISTIIFLFIDMKENIFISIFCSTLGSLVSISATSILVLMIIFRIKTLNEKA